MLRPLSCVSIAAVTCVLATAGCGGQRVTSSVQDQRAGNHARPVPDVATAKSPLGSRATEAAPLSRTGSTSRERSELHVSEAPVTLAQLSPARELRGTPLRSAVPPASMVSDNVKDLFFDLDRASIQGEAKATLDEDARILSARHPRAILIEGYCDERGTSAYNLVLGERRARSVKRYLEDLGATYEITVTSYGKEKPVCKEQNEACWQQNRRAHLAER